MAEQSSPSDLRLRRLGSACKWFATGIVGLILVAWPLSRWWSVSLRLPNRCSVSVMSGAVFVGAEAALAGVPEVPVGVYFQDNLMGELGIFWTSRHIKSSMTEVVMIPLWIPLLFVLAPAGALWRVDIVRRRRHHQNFCPSCGYDRRGLRTGVLCPECGKQPQSAESRSRDRAQRNAR